MVVHISGFGCQAVWLACGFHEYYASKPLREEARKNKSSSTIIKAEPAGHLNEEMRLRVRREEEAW